MTTSREIIEQSFNPDICASILDSWHRTLYKNNCKRNFQQFYQELKPPQKIIVDNWIVNCLIQNNILNTWSPINGIVNIPQEITVSFTPDICASILDSWHRTFYKNNCKGIFQQFYQEIKQQQKIIVDNWIVDWLVQNNVWKTW